MRLFLVFVALLPLVAAEQNLVKLGQQQAELVWGGIPHDLDLPPADGVIQVVAEPNGGQGRVVRFVATRPLRGKLVGRIVASNGSTIQLEGFDLDCCGAPFAPMVELWDGRFPPFWPSAGPTRFDVFHSEGGVVTRVSAFVNPFSAGPVAGPVLGDVLPTRVDGRPYLIVPGPFKTRDVRVMVGWVAAKPSFNQLGQMTFPVPLEFGLFDGNHTLTVCEGGLCTTRVVYISVFPSPPSWPGPPAG